MSCPEMPFDTKIKGEEALDEAAEIIRGGGLVAFPTETVYGLGADAFNEDAVESIFLAKGRPQDNPLIVHIPSKEWLPRVAKNVPEEAYLLFEKFSPGPLTIVLPKIDQLPLITTAGLQTVGIRIPNHPIARELIRAAGCPVAAPSANVSGRISPTEARHVLEDMDGKIPLILDGGCSDIGIESTVLDLSKEVPVVLRPGAITAEMLSVYLGKVVDFKGKVLIAEAPGMKYRHYAPTCACQAARSPEVAAGEARRRMAEGERVVIIGSTPFIRACGDFRLHAQCLFGNAQRRKNSRSASAGGFFRSQRILLLAKPFVQINGGRRSFLKKEIKGLLLFFSEILDCTSCVVYNNN